MSFFLVVQQIFKWANRGWIFKDGRDGHKRDRTPNYKQLHSPHRMKTDIDLSAARSQATLTERQGDIEQSPAGTEKQHDQDRIVQDAGVTRIEALCGLNLLGDTTQTRLTL